jgi:hypothetical protein
LTSTPTAPVLLLDPRHRGPHRGLVGHVELERAGSRSCLDRLELRALA